MLPVTKAELIIAYWSQGNVEGGDGMLVTDGEKGVMGKRHSLPSGCLGADNKMLEGCLMKSMGVCLFKTYTPSRVYSTGYPTLAYADVGESEFSRSLSLNTKPDTLTSGTNW